MFFNIKSKIVIMLPIFSQFSIAQEKTESEKYTKHNKGKIYFFWGGNRESYTKSDIHFTGQN